MNATNCKFCGADTSKAKLDSCGWLCSSCLEEADFRNVRWEIVMRLDGLDSGELGEVTELIHHLTGVNRKPDKFVGVPVRRTARRGR
jgi:hypothetical protein